jgi:hypothetical protein
VEERSGSRQQLFVVLDGLLVGPRRSGTGSGGLGVVAEGLVAVTAHVGQDGGAIHGPTHDDGLCSRQFSARCLSRLEGTRRMDSTASMLRRPPPGLLDLAQMQLGKPVMSARTVRSAMTATVRYCRIPVGVSFWRKPSST